MLSLLTSSCVYLFEMGITYLFFSSITLPRKSHWISLLLGSLLFESEAIINVLFSNTIWINFIVIFVIYFLFSFSCFKLDFHSALVYSVILVVLCTAVEFATIFALSVISGNITDYNFNISTLIINGTVGKLLYFLTCVILAQIIRNRQENTRFPKSFYVFPVETVICLLIFWRICAKPSVDQTERVLLALVSVMLFCSNLFLFFTYTRWLEKEVEYIRVKSENNELQKEQSYYEILEHQNQKVMSYAHDTRNHLAAIKMLNQDPQIDVYLTALSDELRQYTDNCHSGNKMLDVMIDKYIAECSLRGITFTYDVRLFNFRAVEDIDLVTILGNLMDNAISAAEVSVNKTILLETAVRNAFGVLIITNSCDNAPRTEQNRLVTSKREKSLHGFGLKSVRRTLKKYDGEMRWEYEADTCQFITTVMFDKQGLIAFNKP